MKNFKKMSFHVAVKELSRNALKGIMAGSGSNCADMCNVNSGSSDVCAIYGLRCGWFQCNGNLVNRCL